MMMKNDRSDKGSEDLRKRAEESLEPEPDRPGDMCMDEANSLIHELRVHQIELEMQNEELRRVQNDLETSRSRYADLYDFAPVGYLTLNKQGQIVNLNLTAARQLGIERGRLVNKHFQYFVFPPDKKEFHSHLKAILDKRERQIAEVRLSPIGGGQFYARLESVYMDGDDGAGLCRTNMSDVTLCKKAEQVLLNAHGELERRVEERTTALEKANEELRQIPSKLIAVLEEERKRLASELHDSIGQTLAAVKFWVEMTLKLKDAGDCNTALNHLEQFVPILQRSIEETRSIYMGLRPSMLDSKGLLATLEWLRQECMKLYPERHIELEAGIAEEAIPQNLKVNIFRIAQEALNNIAKHSKAVWVNISLSKNGGEIELVVSDDGVGMDLDIIMQTSTASSLGLTSMRERAELTGGSFAIESTPGEGATIRAYWPI
ncbi:MAG: ATP-binding protein [Syntrophobacteraceae bacterium]